MPFVKIKFSLLILLITNFIFSGCSGYNSKNVFESMEEFENYCTKTHATDVSKYFLKKLEDWEYLEDIENIICFFDEEYEYSEFGIVSNSDYKDVSEQFDKGEDWEFFQKNKITIKAFYERLKKISLLEKNFNEINVKKEINKLSASNKKKLNSKKKFLKKFAKELYIQKYRDIEIVNDAMDNLKIDIIFEKEIKKESEQKLDHYKKHLEKYNNLKTNPGLLYLEKLTLLMESMKSEDFFSYKRALEKKSTWIDSEGIKFEDFISDEDTLEELTLSVESMKSKVFISDEGKQALSKVLDGSSCFYTSSLYDCVSYEFYLECINQGFIPKRDSIKFQKFNNRGIISCEKEKLFFDSLNKNKSQMGINFSKFISNYFDFIPSYISKPVIVCDQIKNHSRRIRYSNCNLIHMLYDMMQKNPINVPLNIDKYLVSFYLQYFNSCTKKVLNLDNTAHLIKQSIKKIFPVYEKNAVYEFLDFYFKLLFSILPNLEQHKILTTKSNINDRRDFYIADDYTSILNHISAINKFVTNLSLPCQIDFAINPVLKYRAVTSSSYEKINFSQSTLDSSFIERIDNEKFFNFNYLNEKLKHKVKLNKRYKCIIDRKRDNNGKLVIDLFFSENRKNIEKRNTNNIINLIAASKKQEFFTVYKKNSCPYSKDFGSMTKNRSFSWGDAKSIGIIYLLNIIDPSSSSIFNLISINNNIIPGYKDNFKYILANFLSPKVRLRDDDKHCFEKLSIKEIENCDAYKEMIVIPNKNYCLFGEEHCKVNLKTLDEYRNNLKDHYYNCFIKKKLLSGFCRRYNMTYKDLIKLIYSYI